MKTRAKLVLTALGFVALVTALVVWQTMSRDIDWVARRLSTDVAERSGILRYSVPDYFYEAKTPVVPGRAEEKVEVWSSHPYDTGLRTLVVLRVKNKAFPDPETWSVLLGETWKKEHREFWVLSSTGEKPRCVATAPIVDASQGYISWNIFSWSPEGDWVYLGKYLLGHNPEIYALPLGK